MTRKKMLNKTNVEYGDYAINHVQGCSHGCTYPCYAMLMAKRFGTVKDYDEWIKPVIIENTLELLGKEIPKLKHKIKHVHLCFTTDPFMYGYDDVKKLSLDVIRKLNDNGIKVTVLTKGILPPELADMSKDNEYGITLVSLDEAFRSEYEPNTAPFIERIASLQALHDKGCKTWVSIEPYPTMDILDRLTSKQVILDVLKSIEFVDKIIFGKLNYSKDATKDKNQAAMYIVLSEKVLAFCRERCKQVFIKGNTNMVEHMNCTVCEATKGTYTLLDKDIICDKCKIGGKNE